MMPSTFETVLVTFRGGFVADLSVVCRLLDLEARGARFELRPNGGFRVLPAAVVTSDDMQFLSVHRDEARRVLEYQADDSHLFRDDQNAQLPDGPAQT
jgi:hypothetical protein